MRAFYDLVKLYAEYPSEVTEFINKAESISKVDITTLKKKLTEPASEKSETNTSEMIIPKFKILHLKLLLMILKKSQRQ